MLLDPHLTQEQLFHLVHLCDEQEYQYDCMYTKKIISQRLVLLPYTLCRLTSITIDNTVHSGYATTWYTEGSTVLRCNTD